MRTLYRYECVFRLTLCIYCSFVVTCLMYILSVFASHRLLAVGKHSDRVTEFSLIKLLLLKRRFATISEARVYIPGSQPRRSAPLMLKSAFVHDPALHNREICLCRSLYSTDKIIVREPGQFSEHSVWLLTGRRGDRGSIPSGGKGFFL
jgi:hypothetical protein